MTNPIEETFAGQTNVSKKPRVKKKKKSDGSSPKTVEGEIVSSDESFDFNSDEEVVSNTGKTGSEIKELVDYLRKNKLVAPALPNLGTIPLPHDGGIGKTQENNLLLIETRRAIPDHIVEQIMEKGVRGARFRADQLVRLEDGPQALTTALNVEFGFTPEKLLRVAQNLDPRIVIDVNGDIFLDKVLLGKAFQAYMQKQQNNNLLQISRSSRAALRRNIVLRESLKFLELLLVREEELLEALKDQINEAFGEKYKKMSLFEVLAFLESSRINEEKRRYKTEEAELERAALDQLDQLETEDDF